MPRGCISTECGSQEGNESEETESKVLLIEDGLVREECGMNDLSLSLSIWILLGYFLY
jgi:hypothetical protein